MELMEKVSPKFCSKLPDWLAWNQYWSWFRYAYEVMVVNQWKDVGSDHEDEMG